MGVVSILRLFLCVSMLKYNFHFVCTDFYIFLLVLWWMFLVYKLDNWNVCVGMRMHEHLSESTCDGQKLMLTVFPQISLYLTYWDMESHKSEAHGLCRVTSKWVSEIVLSPQSAVPWGIIDYLLEIQTVVLILVMWALYPLKSLYPWNQTFRFGNKLWNNSTK